jgi:hypothetical protein
VVTGVRRTLGELRCYEEGLVGLFSRRGPARRSTVDRSADLAHLEGFVRSRYGVEAYIEPRTTVTETTVMLIAHDGEWTRRRVPDPQSARSFAGRIGIPIYDVGLTGYPQRMRDYNHRRKQAGKEGTQQPFPEGRPAGW